MLSLLTTVTIYFHDRALQHTDHIESITMAHSMYQWREASLYYHQQQGIWPADAQSLLMWLDIDAEPINTSGYTYAFQSSSTDFMDIVTQTSSKNQSRLLKDIFGIQSDFRQTSFTVTVLAPDQLTERGRNAYLSDGDLHINGNELKGVGHIRLDPNEGGTTTLIVDNLVVRTMVADHLYAKLYRGRDLAFNNRNASFERYYIPDRLKDWIW